MQPRDEQEPRRGWRETLADPPVPASGDGRSPDRAAEELRASEARYRAIVEGQAEMVCRFHPDGTVLFVNGAYARARATTPEALVGLNFWSFVTEEDRPAVQALLDRLTPESPEVRIENRFETTEGVRWTLWTNRALRFDDAGRPIEVQSSGIDITDRKQAEQALRRSEERFRQIADTVDAVFYVMDVAGRQVQYVSPAYQRLWRLDPEELCRDHSTWLARIHPDDRRAAEAAFERFLEEGTPYEAEYRICLPNGDVRWVRDRATVAARSEDGRIARITGIADDVTDHRRHEEQMRTVMAELNHRVKNTLAVIQSIAQQTIRRSPDLRSFEESFDQRLHSIASAHSLLTSTEWRGAAMHDIISSELDARVATTEQCTVTGPAVMLEPQAALGMHMVIHELTTNACKHGGLRSEHGRIAIEWRLEGESDPPRLHLQWTEQSAAPVAEHAEPGFGTRLVEQIVTYELAGEVERELTPNGLRCTIGFPLTQESLPAGG